MGLLFALVLIIAIPAIAYYDAMHTPGTKPIFDFHAPASLQRSGSPATHSATASGQPAPTPTFDQPRTSVEPGPVVATAPGPDDQRAV